jgi:hypothetical protein
MDKTYAREMTLLNFMPYIVIRARRMTLIWWDVKEYDLLYQLDLIKFWRSTIS